MLTAIRNTLSKRATAPQPAPSPLELAAAAVKEAAAAVTAALVARDAAVAQLDRLKAECDAQVAAARLAFDGAQGDAIAEADQLALVERRTALLMARETARAQEAEDALSRADDAQRAARLAEIDATVNELPNRMRELADRAAPLIVALLAIADEANHHVDAAQAAYREAFEIAPDHFTFGSLPAPEVYHLRLSGLTTHLVTLRNSIKERVGGFDAVERVVRLVYREPF